MWCRAVSPRWSLVGSHGPSPAHLRCSCYVHHRWNSVQKIWWKPDLGAEKGRVAHSRRASHPFSQRLDQVGVALTRGAGARTTSRAALLSGWSGLLGPLLWFSQTGLMLMCMEGCRGPPRHPRCCHPLMITSKHSKHNMQPLLAWDHPRFRDQTIVQDITPAGPCESFRAARHCRDALSCERKPVVCPGASHLSCANLCSHRCWQWLEGLRRHLVWDATGAPGEQLTALFSSGSTGWSLCSGSQELHGSLPLAPHQKNSTWLLGCGSPRAAQGLGQTGNTGDQLQGGSGSREATAEMRSGPQAVCLLQRPCSSWRGSISSCPPELWPPKTSQPAWLGTRVQKLLLLWKTRALTQGLYGLKMLKVSRCFLNAEKVQQGRLLTQHEFFATWLTMLGLPGRKIIKKWNYCSSPHPNPQMHTRPTPRSPRVYTNTLPKSFFRHSVCPHRTDGWNKVCKGSR